MRFEFDPSKAEPGATEADLKISEAALELLRGLPSNVCLNVCLNVTAMVICERAKSETGARDEVRNFRRELERCIGINWPHVAEARR